MFRFLFQIIALFIVLAIVRKILTFIVSTVLGSFQAAQQQGRQEAQTAYDEKHRRDELLSSAGELHQDPVCGMYVPESRWMRKVDGQTVYFCSAECRDRFLVAANS